MNKLIDDLSTLTMINSSKLDRLSKLSVYCINEELLESILADKSLVEYDIGIGKLYISTANNELRYKFIPSEELHSSVKNTVESKRNLLEAKIEKSLVSSIEETYKDLL